MQRQTPFDTSIRGYQGGGCITCVDTIDDAPGIQEGNKSHGMKGENWPAHISPQNYGFTSVVADATKDKNGLIQQCAEGVMSFMGGNRNFPVCSVMDDRRHRLKNLAKDAAKGAVALFGLKEWGQQFLNTDTGMYMTGNTQKKVRLQLVDNQNGQQQQGSAPGVQSFKSKSGVQFDIEVVGPLAADAAGGGSQQQTAGQATGQKTLHKEDSTTYVDMTKDAVHSVRGSGNVKVEDGKTQTYHGDPTTSTRADDSHVHIRKGGMKIWVDKGGCWSTVPIKIKSCGDDDNSGSPPSSSDAPAAMHVHEGDELALGVEPYTVTTASPPLVISPDGTTVSMQYSPPIAVGTGTTPPLVLNYASPLALNASNQLTVGPLSIDGGAF
jgi:phage gp45-like